MRVDLQSRHALLHFRATDLQRRHDGVHVVLFCSSARMRSTDQFSALRSASTRASLRAKPTIIDQRLAVDDRSAAQSRSRLLELDAG